LTTGKKATASNVYQNAQSYSAGKAIDGDEETRWATDASTGPCWLEVDLGQPVTFNRAVMQECVDYGSRVKAFELGEPDGLTVHPEIEAGLAVFGGVENQFAH